MLPIAGFRKLNLYLPEGSGILRSANLTLAKFRYKEKSNEDLTLLRSILRLLINLVSSNSPEDNCIRILF